MQWRLQEIFFRGFFKKPKYINIIKKKNTKKNTKKKKKKKKRKRKKRHAKGKTSMGQKYGIFLIK
jgi:hypothetical protein